MGCADSRSSLNDAEKILTSAEHKLRLHFRKVTEIDFIFRKFSHNDSVNSSQLAEAITYLCLPSADNPQVRSFYEALRGGTDKYSLKKLLVAGVLLGRGSEVDKASVLFEVYDDDSSHSLHKAALKQMVDDLYEVVVMLCPAILSALPSSEDAVKVLNYVEQIKYRGDLGKEKLIAKLSEGRDVVSVDIFTKNLSLFDNKDLLKTSGIRDFFFKVYKMVPASYHIDVNSSRSSTGRREQGV